MATRFQEKEWYVDSGVSNHMSNRRDWFINYRQTDNKEVNCANNVKLTSKGAGDVQITLKDTEKPLTISNVSYVSGLNTNLLSVSALVRKNMSVVVSEKGCEIFKKNDMKIQGEPVLRVKEKNGIYILDAENIERNIQESSYMVNQESTTSDAELWHKRMGHLNYSYLSDLRNLVTGLNFKEIPKFFNCVPCLKGKQMRKPFKKSKKASRAREILELVHSDVCGPMQTSSWGGKRYFLTFIDERSRKTFVYFLKGKDEVFEKLREFKELTETQTGRKLKILRTDNGREFVNQKMKEFIKRNGIRHQTTVAYTPK